MNTLLNPEPVPGKTAIIVWPDLEWCYQDAYNEHEWAHKSDDIYVLWIPDSHHEEEVILFIEGHEADLWS